MKVNLKQSPRDDVWNRIQAQIAWRVGSTIAQELARINFIHQHVIMSYIEEDNDAKATEV